jgi:hypothetical protein
MRDHKWMLGVGLTALILFGVIPAQGQIVYGQAASVGARLNYCHWTIESPTASDKVGQFTIPLNAFVPLKDNLEARLFMAEASNSLKAEDETYSLSGLSDIRLQLNQALAEDHVLLSLGVNLPTGKKALNLTEERLVAEYLAYDFLTFPLRRLGEGFGLNATAGLAGASGATRYGAAATFQLNGAYEAFDGMGDYNPGDMVSLNAGLDTRNDKLSFIADMAFTTYTVDKLEDHKVFRQSRIFDIHTGIAYRQEAMTLNGDARYFIRGRNTTYDTTAAETIRDQLKIYGNELFMSLGATWSSRSATWHAGPLLEWRIIGANEYDFGSSHTIAAGFEYGHKLGRTANIGLGVKYFTGQADDGRYDLSGYQLSLGLGSTF